MNPFDQTTTTTQVTIPKDVRFISMFVFFCNAKYFVVCCDLLHHDSIGHVLESKKLALCITCSKNPVNKCFQCRFNPTAPIFQRLFSSNLF